MRFYLTADTDVATFIIFDPAVFASEQFDWRWRKFDKNIQKTSQSGDAFFYSYASDGSANFLLFLDEEPDSRFTSRRGETVSGALLRVPRGRLVATCLEDLTRIPRGNFDVSSFAHTMGSEFSIPAGDYTVEAFEVNWTEDDDDNLDREISTAAGAFDVRLEKILGTTMGLVIVLTIFVLPAAFFILMSKSLRAALFLLGFVALFHLVFWSIAIPLRKSRGLKRVDVVRQQTYLEHPDAVLVLRRVMAIPEPLAPALLGKGLRHLKTVGHR